MSNMQTTVWQEVKEGLKDFIKIFSWCIIGITFLLGLGGIYYQFFC